MTCPIRGVTIDLPPPGAEGLAEIERISTMSIGGMRDLQPGTLLPQSLPRGISQLSSEDLSGRILGYCVEEFDTASQSLVPDDLAFHKLLHFLGLQVLACGADLPHDESTGFLVSIFGGHADDCRICDTWVLEQQGFELGRGNLIAFDLYELLHTVDNEEFAVVVHVSDVSRPKPAIGCEGLLGGLFVPPVALHDVGSTAPEFAYGLRAPPCDLRGAVFGHDLGFTVRIRFTDRRRGRDLGGIPSE